MLALQQDEQKAIWATAVDYMIKAREDFRSQFIDYEIKKRKGQDGFYTQSCLSCLG